MKEETWGKGEGLWLITQVKDEGSFPLPQWIKELKIRLSMLGTPDGA